MAWNPSPEVAVARDAAKQLGNASMCVVLWIDERGEKIGMASYGKTRSLCETAKGIGQNAYEKTIDYIEMFG
jgi:hypothetical protein